MYKVVSVDSIPFTSKKTGKSGTIFKHRLRDSNTGIIGSYAVFNEAEVIPVGTLCRPCIGVDFRGNFTLSFYPHDED